MGRWSDYFEDYPEENPANYIGDRFDPKGAEALRASKAKATSEQAKPVADIFSGCGNGVLDIFISHVIAENNNDWDVSRGDRWLKVCINDDDLEAISLEIVRLVTGKSYDGKENILKLRNDDRQWFAKTFPEFPMLSRINYIFEDAYFDAEEVKLLREECVKIKSSTTNPSAELGLRKLIYSCDEAIKVGFCLGLWCD